MENRLWLNQNRSSYEGLFIFFVFEGILVFTSDGWDVVIGGAIIMFLVYLVMTKFRTMLFIDKKVIVKRTIWFKKIELKLLKLT